jgi:hypothetical protein
MHIYIVSVSQSQSRMERDIQHAPTTTQYVVSLCRRIVKSFQDDWYVWMEVMSWL